ncbi:adenylate kinase [bacterium]|nr:MAG: adenylate kinase [bacterium]
MTRIWILGTCGSGKSTLARQLSQRLGANCIDLDELHWRPNWQTAPEAEFFASLESETQSSSWVIAGNYTKAQKHFLPKVDTIIWLDYSFPFIFARLLKRTWRRVFLHEPCCNGNQENLRLAFSRDSIILWLLRTYWLRRRTNWNTKRRARHRGIRFIHFRHPSQCAKWLQSIGQTEQAR